MGYTAKDIRQRYMQLLNEKKPFFLDKNYSIIQFAADLGTNRSYASKFVNEELGVKFPYLLNSLRLAHFVKLKSENPQARISTLADHCGFNCTLSFRRAFVKKYGVTASDYFKKQNL